MIDHPPTKPWIHPGEPPPRGVDLLLRALSVSVGSHRCGEMWGTDCPVVVHPPSYTHEEHPPPGPTPPRHPGPRRKTLAVHEHIEVADPDCSPQRLRELSTHRLFAVRREVARHPNCPTDVLAQMALDQQGLMYEVACNPSAAATILAAMLDELGSPAGTGYVRRIRAAILAHPNYTPKR